MKQNTNELKIEKRSETEVVMTRTFNAPRELVYDCFTKPELMRRWLIGPDGKGPFSIEHDLKVGGKYLYVYAGPEDTKMGVYGHFIEVLRPQCIANTENYAMDLSVFDAKSPEDANASVESRTFTSEGERTLMTHVVKYASAEICKMVLGEGASEGMEACYVALDGLLNTMIE